MSRSLFARLARRFGPKVDTLTRRDFLRASLAASAGYLLSSQVAYAGRPGARLLGRRVVVVGAGFAGLACASELSSAGYDVTVVEARKRVSGRVVSFGDLVPEKNVEGGGELIGSNHPTWVAYTEKFGLEFLDVTEDEDLEAPLILGGKGFGGKKAKALYEEMDEALKGLNDVAAAVDADQSWKTPGAAELDKKTTEEWVKGLKQSDFCKQVITAQLAADNGQVLSRQSFLGMLTQIKGGGLEKYWTESEVYRCKGGNQQLALKMAEAIGKDRVVLGLPVTAIDRKEDRVTVTCADRRTLEADDVVLAVPPTVWHKIQFSPDLPAGLKPQMGILLKYLAAVKGRFWKERGFAPDSLTDGPVSETWEGTDNQPGDEGAALVAFSGGPPAEVCRSQPRETRDQFYRDELEKIFPGYAENFVASRFMDWPADPWVLAGYSFPAPGQVTTIGPMLYKGLGRLHFAGEHTCYKFVGYMEGGLNSGASLARRLAVRDGVLKDE